MDCSEYENSNSNNNNSNPGCNRSFAYPSGSRTAESGALASFRKRNGYEYGSNTMLNEQNRNNQSQQRASLWLNDQNPYHSGSEGSRPASVMSNLSQLSVATNMSELSIITNITELSLNMGGGSNGSMYQNHNTYPPSAFPTYERQHQVPTYQPNDYLDNLRKMIEKNGLNCVDQILEAKRLAKSQFFEFVKSNVLFKFVTCLFRILQKAFHHKDYKLVGIICSLFHSLLHENILPPYKGSAKRITIKFCIQYIEAVTLFLNLLQSELGNDSKKLVINNVNTILHYRSNSNPCAQNYVKAACQKHPDIIITYLNCLNPDFKNVHSICLDSLSRIISKSYELKKQLMECNGIEIILNIIQTENLEKILFRAVELLDVFLSCVDNNIIKRFIKVNGIDVCAKLLDHGSSRLLHKLIDCINSVCDQLPNADYYDSTKSLTCLVQLLGTQDQYLASKVCGCLGNMISQNETNKKLLCNLKVPELLMRIFNFFTDPDNLIVPNVKVDLIDNVLFVLQGLTSLHSPMEVKSETCIQIMNYQDRIWEKWFMFIISNENCTIVNRALLIVSNILLHLPELIHNPFEYVTVIKFEICAVLKRLLQAIKLMLPAEKAMREYIWNESLLFFPLYYSEQEHEKQKKPLGTIILRSLKLIKILLGDEKARPILAHYFLQYPDFQLILRPEFTSDSQELILVIISALFEHKPELLNIWYTQNVVEAIRIISKSYPAKMELQNAIKTFDHNITRVYHLTRSM